MSALATRVVKKAHQRMSVTLRVVGLLGLALLASALDVEAQHTRKTPLIGFLSGTSPASAKVVVDEFRRGLREVGLVEGQNVTVNTGGRRASRAACPI